MKANRTFFRTQILTTLFFSFILIQTASAGNIGIKGGLSYSGQNYEYSIANLGPQRLNQNGITAGLFYSFNFPIVSELRLEADYVHKGSAIEILVTTVQNPTGIGYAKLEDNLHYVSLNLLATPTLLRLPLLAPYLIVGPRLDILAGKSSDVPSLVLDDLNSTNLGGTVGAGVKIPIKSTASLLVEAVYYHDFDNAFNSGTLNVNNRTFLLTTGLSF